MSNNFFVPLEVDVTPPADVTSFTIKPSDSALVLNWVNPTDSDFVGVVIQWSYTTYPTLDIDGVPNGTFLANVIGGGTQYVHDSLSNGVDYYYTVFSYDGAPNYSAGSSAIGTPEVGLDAIPPPDVNNFAVTTGDMYADLSWDLLSTPDLAGYRISLSVDNIHYGIYSGSLFIADGYYFIDTSTSTYSITELVNGTLYYFRIKSVDTHDNTSTGVVISGMPWSSAGAPVAPDIIVKDPTNVLMPKYLFDFEDTAGDSMTAFELELSDVGDFSHIVYQQLYNASYASSISGSVYSPYYASYFSGWKGYPPGTAPSGMSNTWYTFDVPVELTQGSYFLRVRTRDEVGHYSNFGLTTFVVDTSVTGIQIVITNGGIVNNRVVSLEARVPEDVTEYIASEDPGFSTPSMGMTAYAPFVFNNPPSVTSTVFDVSYSGSGFVPLNTLLTKGDAIRWTNNSASVIMISSTSFSDIEIIPGAIGSYTVANAGNIDYYNKLDVTKTGTIEVLNYNNSKTMSWSLSSGVGPKTVYAKFKDAAANESDVIFAYVILALPELTRPLQNESVKSTLPIMEWSVPQSANGHKLQFKLEIDYNSSFNSQSGRPWKTVETYVSPTQFKYKANATDVNYIAFPIDGVAPGVGSVAFILNEDLSPTHTYYWRITPGT